jgi:hypothetical protein
VSRLSYYLPCKLSCPCSFELWKETSASTRKAKKEPLLDLWVECTGFPSDTVSNSSRGSNAETPLQSTTSSLAPLHLQGSPIPRTRRRYSLVSIMCCSCGCGCGCGWTYSFPLGLTSSSETNKR